MSGAAARPGHPCFVLFAATRSGSTLLVEALRRHPALRAIAREPFNPVEPPDDVAREWPAWFGGPPVPRRADYTRAFGWLFRSYAGFKIMDYQCPVVNPTWAALPAWPNVRFAICFRRNLLDRYASDVLAITTGVWNSSRALTRALPLVRLDVRDTVADVAQRVAWLDHVRAVLPAVPIVYYEDLVADFTGTAERVQRWLGVAVHPLTPGLVKVGPLDYRQVVPGYDKLAAACRDAGYGAWVPPAGDPA